MVSDVAAEKLGQWFDILDATGRGYLTRDDFLAVAARLARSAGVGDAPALTEAYLHLWAFLTGESGIDPGGKLGRDQYISGIASLAEANPRFFDHAVSRIPAAIVALFDADADGRLSKEEFLAVLDALGVSREKADIALLALDQDADGYIGAEEFVAASRQFVLSDDPYAPGNWLLGGLEPKPIRYF